MERRQSSFRASRSLEMEFRRRLRQVAQEIRRMTAIEQSETAIMEQLQRELPILATRTGSSRLVAIGKSGGKTRKQREIRLERSEYAE